jgi:hypothetical protein
MKSERNGSKTSIDRRRFVKNRLTAAGAATVWDFSSANLRCSFNSWPISPRMRTKPGVDADRRGDRSIGSNSEPLSDALEEPDVASTNRRTHCGTPTCLTSA